MISLKELEAVTEILSCFGSFELSNLDQKTDDQIRKEVSEYRNAFDGRGASQAEVERSEIYLKLRQLVIDLRRASTHSDFGQVPVRLIEPGVYWRQK